MLKKIKLLSFIIMILVFVFATTTVFAYEPEVHDFGGETIVFAGNNQDGPDEGEAAWDRMKAAEEEFNVNIEYMKIGAGDINEKTMAAVLAGNAPFDAVQVNDYALAAQGALYPLGDLLGDDFYDSLPGPYQGRYGFKEAVSLDGKAYGFPVNFGAYVTGIMAVWNQELFEEEGITSAYELMENDEWTWEKLKEIALELTKDNDGDGDNDQWGIGGMFPGDQNALLHYLATNNAYLTKEVDGKVKFALNDGGRAAYVLDMMSELQSAGVVHGQWNAWDEFKNGNIGVYFLPLWAAQNTKTDNFTQGMAYVPRGPESDKYVFGVDRNVYMAIPVTTEDPKPIVDLYLSMNPIEKMIEEDLELRANNADDMEGYKLMVKMINNFELVTKYRTVLTNKNCWFWLGQITKGNSSASESFAEMEPKVQAALDDFLDQ